MQLIIEAASYSDLCVKVKDLHFEMNSTKAQFPPELQQAVVNSTPKEIKSKVKTTKTIAPNSNSGIILTLAEEQKTDPISEYTITEIRKMVTDLIAAIGPQETQKIMASFKATHVGGLDMAKYDEFMATGKKHLK